MSSDVIFPSDVQDVHFHFVGIKGTGMVALVEILKARGAVITGSDVSERFYTDEILDRLNIKALPFSEKNITSAVQFVIYSSAYNLNQNPDLICAQKKGIPCLLYSEALGALSRASFSCGICGVHGKTTTTGLCGTILKNLPLSSQVLAGSIIASFDNSCVMNSPQVTGGAKPEFFAAETCEYQRHFMAFSPSKIILTSVESDHQDYYPTFNDIQNAFVDYICRLPKGGTLIYCADDKGALQTADIALSKRPDIHSVPYGTEALGDYKIKPGKVEAGCQHFIIEALGDFELYVPGFHNVRNAAAAIALCASLLSEKGLDVKDFVPNIKNALKSFSGGKRRSEITGRAKTPSGKDVIFIDDYAHHPTAIKTTLEGYRKFYTGYKIIVDFMSHTYSRTAALLEDFASSFGSADSVILNKIYASARESIQNASVTGKTLFEHAKKYHNDVTYEEEFSGAAEKGFSLLLNDSSKYPEGFLFVTMGAGDNWKVGKAILEKLNGSAK